MRSPPNHTHTSELGTLQHSNGQDITVQGKTLSAEDRSPQELAVSDLVDSYTIAP